ncbi:cyclase family protein [Jatrophihabitans sp. DSM 45814]
MSRVSRIVDLSVPVDEATQIYPGDPTPRIRTAATIESDGFNLLSVHIGSQTGTHVDAPYHFSDRGLRIDELDLKLFTGPAVVLDVRAAGARGRIGWDLIEPYADRLHTGVISLFHTGWSVHYGTQRYFDNPFLDADACRRMLELGVRTFLMDAVNIDETPDDAHPGEGFPVHHLIADAHGVIGENLSNVAAIDFDPFVSCLPLRLTGADGAPVRAVAIELNAAAYD